MDRNGDGDSGQRGEREIRVRVMAIWFARNNLVFQNTALAVAKIAELARKHVEDYIAANHRNPAALRRDTAERWLPPEQGILKLNTDATCKLGCGTGVRCVLRNDKGRVLWMEAEVINESISVDVAEAQAVLHGVRLVMDKGAQNLVVELDSQVTYIALRRPKESVSYFGGIVDEILTLCRSFNSCIFSWVQRTANKVAHELSHFAYSCDVAYVHRLFRR